MQRIARLNAGDEQPPAARPACRHKKLKMLAWPFESVIGYCPKCGALTEPVTLVQLVEEMRRDALNEGKSPQ